MILLVDHQDSFTHNIRHALWQAGAEVVVVPSRGLTPDRASRLAPEKIVLSAGPGAPMDHPETLRLIRWSGTRLPLLGVCLGHQCLAWAYGGQVRPARHPRHGETCRIFHQGAGVLRGMAVPFLAARYNSLVVEAPPPGFDQTGWDEAGELMAMAYGNHPLFGVQFHPESFLTGQGGRIFSNFLAL
ncbi:MAG: aminodeoxychorismate/anthranilate synthase component II [Deltaproteobacteria bacterium]|nr:aminodeoxychorismate/anthranilate synthase component II [Deltaproteobacteria bacterium]